MRVLFDTDLLLDVALRRAEFFIHRAAVLQWAESHPHRACKIGIRVHFCCRLTAYFFWQQFSRPWDRTHSWSM